MSVSSTTTDKRIKTDNKTRNQTGELVKARLGFQNKFPRTTYKGILQVERKQSRMWAYLPWVSRHNCRFFSWPSKMFDSWMALINSLKYSLVGPPSSNAPSALSSSSTNTTSNFASGLKCLRLNARKLHRKMLFLHTFIWLLVGQELPSTLLTSFFSMVCRSIL